MTATGAISVPLESLRTLISESSTFQTWVNAEDETAALDRVFVEGVPGVDENDKDLLVSLRPFALVTFDTVGDSLLSFFGGTLLMMFESDISEENLKDHRDAAYEFTNNVGAVVVDVRNASYEAGKLFIRTIEAVGRPARSDPKEDMGRYMQMWFKVSYGLENL